MLQTVAGLTKSQRSSKMFSLSTAYVGWLCIVQRHWNRRISDIMGLGNAGGRAVAGQRSRGTEWPANASADDLGAGDAFAGGPTSGSTVEQPSRDGQPFPQLLKQDCRNSRARLHSLLFAFTFSYRAERSILSRASSQSPPNQPASPVQQFSPARCRAARSAWPRPALCRSLSQIADPCRLRLRCSMSCPASPLAQGMTVPL